MPQRRAHHVVPALRAALPGHGHPGHSRDGEANTSLGKTLARMPENITFVVAMLTSCGIGALASRVAVLLKAPYTLERHIVLVNDHETWSDEIITRLRAVTPASTTVTVVRIPGLAALITDAYSAAAAGLPAASGGQGHGA